MKRGRKESVLAFMAAMALATGLHAATQIEEVNVPAATVASGVTAVGSFGYPVTMTFPKFDPALGMLDEVLIEHSFDLDMSLTITGGGGAGSGSMGGTFFVNGVAFGGNGNGNGSGGPGPAVLPLPFVVAGSSTLSSMINPPAFAEFAGSGDAVILWDALVNLDPGGNSMDLAMKDTSFGRVTYSYTPVPEPTSCLLAAGLSAMLLRRRRSSAQA